MMFGRVWLPNAYVEGVRTAENGSETEPMSRQSGLDHHRSIPVAATSAQDGRFFSSLLGVAWYVMAIVASQYLPGASYLFILPGLALATAAGIAVLVHVRNEWLVPLIVLLPAVVGIIVILPSVFIVELMLGYDALIGTLASALLLVMVFVWAGPMLSRLPTHWVGRNVAPVLTTLVIVALAFSLKDGLNKPSSNSHPDV